MLYIGPFLMAAKLPLPKRIFGHGWILSDEKNVKITRKHSRSFRNN